MKITMTSLVTIVCLLGAVDGARILAIFPFNVRSHYSVYEPLLKRLSARGHEIVAMTHFPQRIQLANFTDMNDSFVLPSRINTIRFPDWKTIWKRIQQLILNGINICESVLSHPEMKRIIDTKKRFDLLVIEVFATDCFLGIAHILNIPKVK